MSGFVQVYLCVCSDSALRAEDLPATCPGHGEPVTGRAPGSRFIDVMPRKHDCHERICTTPTPPTTEGNRE